MRVENRRFYAEKMGEIVTDRLEENFRELMNYDFTAQMENSLDQVANHEAEWKAVLDHFFSDFTQQLDKAEKDPEEGDAPEPDGSDQHRLPDLWSQNGYSHSEHRGIPWLFRLRSATERALQNHHQPGAGKRSAERAGR